MNSPTLFIIKGGKKEEKVEGDDDNHCGIRGLNKNKQEQNSNDAGGDLTCLDMS
jgi:hypothetical protein